MAMMKNGKKFTGAYGGKMMDKKKPKLMPGGKKSGMDPHAVQDKWQKKQMDMLKPPKGMMKKKKMMKKGMNPLKGM